MATYHKNANSSQNSKLMSKLLPRQFWNSLKRTSSNKLDLRNIKDSEITITRISSADTCTAIAFQFHVYLKSRHCNILNILQHKMSNKSADQQFIRQKRIYIRKSTLSFFFLFYIEANSNLALKTGIRKWRAIEQMKHSEKCVHFLDKIMIVPIIKALSQKYQ